MKNDKKLLPFGLTNCFINSYSLYGDGELVAFLRKGDKLAFEEIYNRYRQPAYRYLITLLKDPEFAKDLIHEVFIKVWDIRGKLEIKDNFKGYLFRICHNKAVDFIKKAAEEHFLKDRLLHCYQGFFIEETPSVKDFEHFDNLIDEALNTLSPARRKVYELCKYQGKSHQEVAEELQISPNTVKEHMSKALASLRAFIEQRRQLIIILLLFQIFL